MMAVRLHARGGAEQIVYEPAPLPEPGPGEVRVRVRAAGLTPAELGWDETYRFADGRDRLPSIPGHDVSGVVDAVGPGVTTPRVDDAVYGLIDFPCDGSAAEYVIAPAADLAPKPRTLDHVHAAAVPLSALTAWQALFEHGQVSPGRRVLIHGAAGGVGAYAVRLAKDAGATVIATASARHEARLAKLGVDAFVDYSSRRFEDVARSIDFVLDPFGGEVRERSWQTLRPGGTLVALSEPIRNQPRDDVRAIFFIVRPNRSQLVEIARLIDDGTLAPSIEAVYPLAEARAAFARAAEGHLGGKLVLRVD